MKLPENNKNSMENKINVLRQRLRCPFRQLATSFVLKSFRNPSIIDQTGFVAVTLSENSGFSWFDPGGWERVEGIYHSSCKILMDRVWYKC